MTAYDAGAAHRLRRLAPTTVQVQYRDATGAAADPGVVTLTMIDPDGATVLIDAPTVGTGTAPRVATLGVAQTATLGAHALTWSSAALGPAAQTAEIVGGELFTVAEARLFDKRNLADPDDYPAELILEAHDRIAEEFTRILGVPPYPMRLTATLDGHPDSLAGYGEGGNMTARSRELLLPSVACRELLDVELRTPGKQTWTPLTVAQMADTSLTTDGCLIRDTAWGWPHGRANVRVTYVAGWPATPLALRRAALIVLVNEIIPNNLSDRATMEIANGHTFRLSTADGARHRWYGLPYVDAALARYRLPSIGIG